MKHSLRIALIVFWSVLILMLIALTSVVLGQDGTSATSTPAARRNVTQDEVNRIARQMYCPVCENEPLDACRTAACQQWRAQIGQMLSEGQTEQQIKDYFVTRYGVRVLAQPPAQGVSLWLYVLPVVGLLIGAVVVVWIMRRMRARAAQPTALPPAQSTEDEYANRVERDLKDY